MSYQIADLLYLMTRLRDPEKGCGWDLKQTFASIVPHTIEEAYEVAEAIEQEDFAHLPSELGDLLFQVVYYCQLANEENRFEFKDVINAIVEKLIRRHPHVFPNGDLYAEHDTPQQPTSGQWEAIKAAERKDNQLTSAMADVPLALPALTRAVKLQKRASRLGFDWQDGYQIFAKLDEEVAEFKQALKEQNSAAIEHELGDILLTVTNLARHFNVEPEHSLRKANQRFSERFEYIEKELNYCFTGVSKERMEALWEEAKNK